MHIFIVELSLEEAGWNCREDFIELNGLDGNRRRQG